MVKEEEQEKGAWLFFTREPRRLYRFEVLEAAVAGTLRKLKEGKESHQPLLSCSQPRLSCSQPQSRELFGGTHSLIGGSRSNRIRALHSGGKRCERKFLVTAVAARTTAWGMDCASLGNGLRVLFVTAVAARTASGLECAALSFGIGGAPVPDRCVPCASMGPKST